MIRGKMNSRVFRDFLHLQYSSVIIITKTTPICKEKILLGGLHPEINDVYLHRNGSSFLRYDFKLNPVRYRIT